MKTIKVVKKITLAVLAFLLIGCVFASVKALDNAYADGEITDTTITFTKTKVNVSTDGTKMLIATGINNTEYLSNVSELGYKIEGYEVKESDFAEKNKYYSSITLVKTKQTASDIFGESATENSKLLIWEVAYTAGSTYKITAYATVYTDGTASEVKGTERSYECVKFDSKLTTIPTAKTGLVYTGSDQALVEAGTATGGTIQYKVGDGEYSEAIPTATAAGDYMVYYKVAGDANHNDTTEASVSVTIAKANNAITWGKDGDGNIVGLDFTYVNEPNETTAKAIAGTITYTYTLVNKNSTADPSEPAEDAKYSAWSDDNTSGLYKCLVTASETDNYKSITADRWVRVHKADNVITLSVDSLDCNWGSGPDETKATATYGTPVYTYWLSNSDSYGNVTEPGSDAVFKSWSEYNAVGVYKCRITVAESDNYKAGILEKWVRVHKKEQDENGVKYTYGDGAYYVSGYVGSSTEVTVASTFNDGANGEKSVTYVGAKAFNGNTAITKVVLPETVTCFGGVVFFDCTSLVSVDMRGVKDLYQDNQTAGLDGSKDRNINFWNCSALQYVIVGSGFKTNVNQYNGENALTLYVNGTDATDITNTDKIGTTYYLGDGVACQTWKFDDNGEIVKGPAHNFVDGACKTCGADQTAGITYAVSGDTAYVASYSGTATEVYVRSTYEDKPVTYVAQRAFESKTMKKVVLPESVTDLGGFVFHQCPNLEYVDARGVKNIQYANASARADGKNESNNNFRSCDKLTTVIIGDGFSSNVGQFTGGTESSIALYVYGTTAATLQDGDSAVDKTKIYYYSETQPTDTAKTYWHYVDGVATVWTVEE